MNMLITNLKNKWNNEKGFMSIEAIMGMATILMVILLGIGFFSYLIPRQAIEEEVHLVGRVVKMQGGYTATDVEGFRANMVKRGMVKTETKDKVIVKVYLENTAGQRIRELAPGEKIPRGFKSSGQFVVMKLYVEVPANKTGINGALTFFSTAESLSDKHVFSERIMSEYYGG